MRRKSWGVVVLSMLLAVMSIAGSSGARAQSREEARGPERFAPLDWLVGEWQGYGKFNNRTTYIHKKYSYEVGGMFLVERTLDMFPPPEPSTDYETHQDFSVFYQDHTTGAFRVKGFFVESYVTSADVRIANGDSIVVETTAIENGPSGMRTRFSMVRQGSDRFRAFFEIAMPGKEYAMVEELDMKRIE